MRKLISIIFITLFFGLSNAVAQGNTKSCQEISLPQYQDWKLATVEGKLKMSGLPLSPGLRIFMEKDSLVEISIRVPLMGEVGRIELTPEYVLGINKMKKTYSRMAISDFLKFYPGNFSDLQELLLGRVVMPGVGIVRPEIIDFIDIYLNDSNHYAAIPKEEIAIEGFEYGYLVDFLFRPSVLLAVPKGHPEVSLMVSYLYSKDGYEMGFNFREETKGIAATLDLKNPVWSGTPLKPISLDNKYTRVEIWKLLSF